MSDCASTYTIDRRTGEALTCNGQHLTGNWRRGQAHNSKWRGASFYWYDDEADQ